MQKPIPTLLFERDDYELLSIVNDVLSRDRSKKYLRKLFDPYLHPHGIMELAAPREIRIAYAVVYLLGSLQVGTSEDRVRALRALHRETLAASRTQWRKNTARVLIEIMRNIIQAHGDFPRQLQLAHDFRIATAGRARVIRRFLKEYDLLEMPEAWNQLTFDHHVHDLYTKGEKTPTQLVLDAWVKGVRTLTVVYYNFLRPEAAAELLEAAKIMEMDVRIGVEYRAAYRGGFANFIWIPQGLSDPQDFLAFMASPMVNEFMEKGRQVTAWVQERVLQVLKRFNQRELLLLNDAWGLDLEPVDPKNFLEYVDVGQASLYHLAKFVHANMLPAMERRVETLRALYETSSPDERRQLEELVRDMNQLSSEDVLKTYLPAEEEAVELDPSVSEGEREVPELLRLTPQELIDALRSLPAGCHVVLNPSNLCAENVVELIYDCEAMINRLEIFNLKDYSEGKTDHIKEIVRIQRALNQGNVIRLKRVITDIMDRIAASSRPDREARLGKFEEILNHIGSFNAYYAGSILRSNIGSDSTGRSRHLHGMGLAITETLPRRARRQLSSPAGRAGRMPLPVRASIQLRRTYDKPPRQGRWTKALLKRLEALRKTWTWGHRATKDWLITDFVNCRPEDGNIISVSGPLQEIDNRLVVQPQPEVKRRLPLSWRYLNSRVRNGIKVAIGIIPAFLTFALTRDWWVLAYFGAFIWYALTGLRFVFQSLLGGGGPKRSVLIKWDETLNWDRVADALLYAGFAAPLLDLLVKTWLLDQRFGINTTTNPAKLYTVLALVSGTYILAQRAIRGLPREALVGNLFRAILSIPLALLFNSVLGGLLEAAGLLGTMAVLQQWAAVISKAASDCVSGIVEGLADRGQNVRMRMWDYQSKLDQIIETYARFEVAFPDVRIPEAIESPREILRRVSLEEQELERNVIINALDLCYFWMYQPLAREVFRTLIRKWTEEERQVLAGSQLVLRRQKQISQLFVDGLVGKKFSMALSFYLEQSEAYLAGIQKLVQEESGKD